MILLPSKCHLIAYNTYYMRLDALDEYWKLIGAKQVQIKRT